MLVPGRAHVVLNSRGQQEINCHLDKACADWDLTLGLLGKDFMSVPLIILSYGWKPCLFQHLSRKYNGQGPCPKSSNQRIIRLMDIMVLMGYTLGELEVFVGKIHICSLLRASTHRAPLVPSLSHLSL